METLTTIKTTRGRSLSIVRTNDGFGSMCDGEWEHYHESALGAAAYLEDYVAWDKTMDDGTNIFAQFV
jgi:hypothetical protein